MLWNKDKRYIEVPFDKESDLEDAVLEVKDALFGPNRIYLDEKRAHRRTDSRVFAFVRVGTAQSEECDQGNASEASRRLEDMRIFRQEEQLRERQFPARDDHQQERRLQRAAHHRQTGRGIGDSAYQPLPFPGRDDHPQAVQVRNGRHAL